MSIFRKYSVFSALALSVALLASACTVNFIDPNAVSDGGTEMAVSNISAEMPYETQFVEVNGSQMAYVEAGEGDPILFLHGNPTSKYLWRNIMPHLEGQGRVIAPDLIGMGESDKPDIGYTFVEHAEYVQGFIDAMELEDITLVIHDWGSGLGFDYANRNRNNVKAIAFMEAAVAPAFPPKIENLEPDVQQFMQGIRTEGMGEQLILENNLFVAQFLPSDIRRGLTEEEMAVYLAPYPDPQSRLPTLVWPRQIPFDGEPADVAERVAAYNEWFLSSEMPKLHLYVDPGAIWSIETVAEIQAMNVPNYEAVYVGEGGHFIQEDHPHEIGRNISHWYHRISQ
ncbi:MAG: haloalkane dehalogenase [Chloroflexota bacterium]